MTESRTSNSLRNVSFGLLSQVVQMILGFVSRTIFVNYLAVEYLGVNSLFTNILSMLSLAELGIGSAFIYSLYKPLAEKDEIAIATIMQFYKKVYVFIAFFIFFSGLILIPFLEDIIPQKPDVIIEDIRLIYLIFLFNSASTYLFSYKIALLDADQKNSVVTKYSIVFLIFQNLLQIATLIIFKNFIYYLLIQLVCGFLSNFYISKKVDKRYSFLVSHKNKKISNDIKNKILKNAKATFFVKIGGVLVNGTDNIIINYFVGLAVLGKFSNYVMLISIASSFLMILFANVKSSIANVTVKESNEKQVEVFKVMNFANFWLYGCCTVFIIILINDFIEFWIGTEFILSWPIVIILAINFFMVGMQNAFWTFKSIYGFFEQGKYLVLLTAIINLGLSFLLGSFYGIFGVLLATAIARLVTNFWYDPYIVLKLGLRINPLNYLKLFLKYVLTLLVSVFVIYFLGGYFKFSIIINIIFKAVLCFVIPNLIIIIVFRKNTEFKKTFDFFQNGLQLMMARIRLK